MLEQNVLGFAYGFQFLFKGNTLVRRFDELEYCTGLTKIADEAFSGCVSLRKVTLPAGLKTIGQNTFTRTYIECMVVPEGVTEVEKNFLHMYNVNTQSNTTQVRLIDLPSTLTVLGDAPNYNGSPSSRLNLICRATVPPTFSGFWGYTGGTPGAIYVPDGSVDAYKTATGWSGKASYIQPLGGYAKNLRSLSVSMTTGWKRHIRQIGELQAMVMFFYIYFDRVRIAHNAAPLSSDTGSSRITGSPLHTIIE